MDRQTLLKIRDLAGDPLGIIFVREYFDDGKYRWNGALQKRHADGSYSLYSPDNEDVLRVIDKHLTSPAPRGEPQKG